MQILRCAQHDSQDSFTRFDRRLWYVAESIKCRGTAVKYDKQAISISQLYSCIHNHFLTQCSC